MTGAVVASWLTHYAAVISAEANHLSELDAAIGDADHGINMERGWARVRDEVVNGDSAADVGSLFKQVGMKLVSSVGGASGVLFGSFFMRMGSSAEGLTEMDANQLGRALGAGVGAVKERGKAAQGDKTMLDALVPAVAAFDRAVSTGASIKDAASEAADAAEEGCRATRLMKAMRGRAAFLGERSVGHEDPGATSAALLIRSLHEAISRT